MGFTPFLSPGKVYHVSFPKSLLPFTLDPVSVAMLREKHLTALSEVLGRFYSSVFSGFASFFLLSHLIEVSMECGDPILPLLV